MKGNQDFLDGDQIGETEYFSIYKKIIEMTSAE